MRVLKETDSLVSHSKEKLPVNMKTVGMRGREGKIKTSTQEKENKKRVINWSTSQFHLVPYAVQKLTYTLTTTE